MKRRTLDIMFSAGGIVLAGLLLIAGLVLASNANFSKHYVRSQLADQGITFKTADLLTPAEKAYTQSHTGCLIKYAGQPVITGKQAECYANELVGGHLKDPQKILNANGMNYVQLGKVQADLRTKITDATAAKDPSLAALQKQLDDVTAARNTVFQGTMLRNALLTSYGFSVLGDKADLGSRVAYIGALVLVLLSIAGFVHAFVTPKNKPFAAVEPVTSRTPVKLGV